MKTLGTKRTILKKLSIDDTYDLYEYFKMDYVVPMAGIEPHKTIDETKKYIEEEIPKEEVYGIVEKNLNKVIGTIGLHKRKAKSGLDIRLLSILLNPKFWGFGYAYEVTIEIIKYAFDEIKVHKLIIGHFSFNKQSESVIKKLGFIYEGRKREVYIYKNELVDGIEYSMLRRDYEAVKNKWEKRRDLSDNHT